MQGRRCRGRRAQGLNIEVESLALKKINIITTRRLLDGKSLESSFASFPSLEHGLAAYAPELVPCGASILQKDHGSTPPSRRCPILWI